MAAYQEDPVSENAANSSAQAKNNNEKTSGERLYNGIVLPEVWPPRYGDPETGELCDFMTYNLNVPNDNEPMPVPYLEHRPAVVPIEIGRQLFVDDFLIETTDLKRVYHQPKKYEQNPILKPETELEINPGGNAGAAPKSGGVWWDPFEKIFKMWYEAGWLGTVCYATSLDGLHWERPQLDVVPGTNQVLPPDLKPDSWVVIPDWETSDPSQRYKMFFRGPGGSEPGVSLTSPDGIHWNNRVSTGQTFDRSTVFYNPFRKKWVYSLRSVFHNRARHYWECDDFMDGAKWEVNGPVPWTSMDKLDLPDPEIGMIPQLYNLDAVAYESIILGFFELHLGPENDICEKTGLPKITELSFAYSRDGFHWSRPDRRAHIRAERRDVWDRGYVQSIGNICCVRGDTLWFYYIGFQGDSSKPNRDWMVDSGYYDRSATGVAFLRRDGFVSMETDDKPGTLTTRPVIFSGTQLFVNVDSSKGSLRVEVLDEKGSPIEPFTLKNCTPISENSTIMQVKWNDGMGRLDDLQNQPVRFRFSLENTSLYSFWVSQDESGRSDGYVAGGGPGFTGMTDTQGLNALTAEGRERHV